MAQERELRVYTLMERRRGHGRTTLVQTLMYPGRGWSTAWAMAADLLVRRKAREEGKPSRAGASPAAHDSAETRRRSPIGPSSFRKLCRQGGSGRSPGPAAPPPLLWTGRADIMTGGETRTAEAARKPARRCALAFHAILLALVSGSCC